MYIETKKMMIPDPNNTTSMIEVIIIEPKELKKIELFLNAAQALAKTVLILKKEDE